MKAMETVISKEIMRTVMLEFIGTFINDWYAEMWWTAPGKALGGQSDVSRLENGQSSCILPSGPYVMLVKLKKAITKNDSKTRGAVIFLNVNAII